MSDSSTRTLTMNTRGVRDVGRGCFAYVQPRGTWGLSNAGLVCDGDESLLVDTMFDLAHTRAMWSAFRAAAPAPTTRVSTVVNTHHNGDHCFGNELFPDSEIVASERAVIEMRKEPPALIGQFMKAAPQMGLLGEYLQHCFGAYQFDGITPRLPQTTFSGRLSRTVGARRVELIEVGPAHTAGDVIVHVPDARVLFTGDVVFVEVHPVMWAGPVSNWIAVCDQIEALAPDVVVPGHGPVGDMSAVREMRRYLGYVRDETRRRFDAGMSAHESMRDIALGDFDAWGDAERIAVNVSSLYREFASDPTPPSVPDLFGAMATVWAARRAG